MPDLSHRPTRYTVAALAVAAVAVTAVSTLPVRVGPDTELAAARKRTDRLEQENRTLRRVVTRQATQLAATDEATASSRANAVATAAPNCARYATQEDAQGAFVADPLALRALDGDGDGAACEQLKSGAPAPTSSAAAPALSLGNDAETSESEPAPPAQEEPPSVGPTLPDAPSKAEIVASGHHFGLATATTEELDQLDFSLGRRATMRGYYKGWDTAFDTARVIAAWQRGEVPAMTWESRPLATADDTTDYSLARIAAGDFDDYLTTYAQDIVGLGLPLVIRFDHEMNGTWYRWSEANPQYGNTKGDYVAAWRHIHDLFDTIGANQYVVWTWSPNRVENRSHWPGIENYWPGREYVDWVGMTGYYRPGDGKATFENTYHNTLAALRKVAPGVPILLTEVGATDVGMNKVAWINSFFDGLAANPDIAGFIWFNYAITEKQTTNDWRVNSTDAVFQTFKAGITASTYGREPGKTPRLVPLGDPPIETTTTATTTTAPPTTTPPTTTTTTPPTTTTTTTTPPTTTTTSPTGKEAP